MYKLVRDVLASSDTSWEGIPALVSTIEEFNAKVRLIEKKEEVQQSVSAGVSLATKDGKMGSYEKMLRIAGALRALASSTNDKKLIREVRFTKSGTVYSSKIAFLTRVDIVIQRANEHADELANYGVTAEEIAGLLVFRDDFDKLLSDPRKAINKRKNANADIYILEREVDELIYNRIDPLMLGVKESDPVLYNDYVSARKLIDNGH